MFNAFLSWGHIVYNHVIKITTRSTDCYVVLSWNSSEISKSPVETLNYTVSSCFFQSLLNLVTSLSFVNSISHNTKFWLFLLRGFIKGLNFLLDLLLSISATRNFILTCLVLSLTILILSLCMGEFLLLHVGHIWELLSLAGNFIFLTAEWFNFLLPAINLKLQVSA